MNRVALSDGGQTPGANAPGSPGLKILAPGLCTLVVDHGRSGSRHLGVPLGGAADRTSLALGNALVGNLPAAAALEISLAGPTLEVTSPLACVVFGAPFELTSPRQSLVAGKTFTLEPGEVLTIGGTTRGMRAYLCVHGGIQADVVLGSRSSLAPLRAGQHLPCVPAAIRWAGGSAEPGPPCLAGRPSWPPARPCRRRRRWPWRGLRRTRSPRRSPPPAR